MPQLRRSIPNIITIVRLVLVLPIAFFIVESQFVTALALFALAGLSDGLDGWIARRYQWVSAFGKLIDPLADKLLMIVTTLTLGLLDYFPLMLTVLIISKDLAVLGGVFAYTTLAGFPKIQPSLLGKITTAGQILLLASLLLNLSFPGLVPLWFFEIWFWVVALTTALDGMSYLWLWTHKLANDHRWSESLT